jgi:hypothetical protein
MARASPVPSVTSGATADPPPSAAEFRCVSLTLRSHLKTSNSFPEFSGRINGGKLDLPDQPRAGLRTDRGLTNNGTASGDSGLKTAGLPPLAVRISKEPRLSLRRSLFHR